TGFESIADILSSSFIEQLGMNAHYKSMSRGVLDTRDIVYFLSITIFFIILTSKRITTKGLQKNEAIVIIGLFMGLFALNIISSNYYGRFDLTSDNRYTISEASLEIIDEVQSPIIVDIFLEGEGFPSEFRRLQTETRQILEEFAAHNKNIVFHFINPIADET